MKWNVLHIQPLFCCCCIGVFSLIRVSEWWHMHRLKNAHMGKSECACLSTGCMCEWISQPSARRGRGTNEGRLSCLSRASYFSFPAYGRDNKTCSIYVNWQRASPVNRHAPKILPGNLEARSPPTHARFILHQPPQHACVWLVFWPKSLWCMNSSSSLFSAELSSTCQGRKWSDPWVMSFGQNIRYSAIMRGGAGRETNER